MTDTGNRPGAFDNSGTMLITERQRLFVRYLLGVLIDLTVLNLFVEYWDRVVIDSFTISLFAAVVLQIMLRSIVLFEHRMAEKFAANPGRGATAKRLLTAWALSFGGKFVILGAIGVVFGEHVDFGGVAPFFVVAFSILIAEAVFTRITYMAFMRPE